MQCSFQLIPEPQMLTIETSKGLKRRRDPDLSSMQLADELWNFPKQVVIEEYGFDLQRMSLNEYAKARGLDLEDTFARQEGYFLEIGENLVIIGADTLQAAFYATQTLGQILASPEEEIPALRIKDWPDLEMRGFNICYHTAVPNMPSLTPSLASLLHLIRWYSHLKMNMMLFEPEGLFPFQKYPQLSNPYAFSHAEIRGLRDLCSQRFVAIIPLLQCLGHAYQVLRHEEFAHLRELPETSQQYCPCNPDVPAFYLSLADELLDALGPVERFHLGGDESRRLGKCGTCSKKVAESGMGALYGDYVNQVARGIASRGVKPLIWADIAEDHPDILQELDPDIGLFFWNYDMVDWRPYAMEQFAGTGREVHGSCAAKFGAHSDYMFLYQKAMRNISLMASECRRNRLKGMLVTDWVKLAPNEVGIIANSFGAHVAWSFRNPQAAFAERFARVYFGIDDLGCPQAMNEAYTLVTEFSNRKKDIMNRFWTAPYGDLNDGFMPDWLDRFDWSGRDFTGLLRQYATQEALPQVRQQLETAIIRAEQATALFERMAPRVRFNRQVFDVVALAAPMQRIRSRAGLLVSQAIPLLKYPSPGDAVKREETAARLAEIISQWHLLREVAYELLLPGTFEENLIVNMDFKFDPDFLRFMDQYRAMLLSGEQLQGVFSFVTYPAKEQRSHD